MKKLGIVALALFMQTAFAQTNRFVYQVTMKSDASNKNDVKTENAYLDISAENLFFILKTDLKEILLCKKLFKVEAEEEASTEIRWKA
jgi:GLPGLI family protein